MMQHANDFQVLCAEAKTRIQEVTIDEVASALQANKVDYLIDVRDADEFAVNHIPEAQHISKGWIEAKIRQATDDNKDASIVLYCGGGNRSALAADNLQKMGYQNVSSMIGGFKAYQPKYMA